MSALKPMAMQEVKKVHNRPSIVCLIRTKKITRIFLLPINKSMTAI